MNMRSVTEELAHPFFSGHIISFTRESLEL